MLTVQLPAGASAWGALALVFLLVSHPAASTEISDPMTDPPGLHRKFVDALSVLKDDRDTGDPTATRAESAFDNGIDSILRYALEHRSRSQAARVSAVIADMYLDADDYVGALLWVRLAAERGHAGAQTALGDFHRMGLGGIAKDELAAVHWYRNSAEQGHVAGQRELGLAYVHGGGVPKDKTEGRRWLRIAAEAGDAHAAFIFGLELLPPEGKEVPVATVQWVRTAAERGHTGAQTFLGDFYSMGDGGLAKDYITAMHWYRRSAEQGDALGQLALGRSYALGEGTLQDATQAYAWLSVGLAQGSFFTKQEEWARATMDRLRKNMTKQEFAQAQELARRYWSDHVLPYRESSGGR